MTETVDSNENVIPEYDPSVANERVFKVAPAGTYTHAQHNATVTSISVKTQEKVGKMTAPVTFVLVEAEFVTEGEGKQRCRTGPFGPFNTAISGEPSGSIWPRLEQQLVLVKGAPLDEQVGGGIPCTVEVIQTEGKISDKEREAAQREGREPRKPVFLNIANVFREA